MHCPPLSLSLSLSTFLSFFLHGLMMPARFSTPELFLSPILPPVRTGPMRRRFYLIALLCFIEQLLRRRAVCFFLRSLPETAVSVISGFNAATLPGLGSRITSHCIAPKPRRRWIFIRRGPAGGGRSKYDRGIRAREGLCRYQWIFIRPAEDLWTEKIRPRNSGAGGLQEGGRKRVTGLF